MRRAGLAAGVAAVFLFGLAGSGSTRLLLPTRPAPARGAVGAAGRRVRGGAAMTVLGFAYVPFHVALATSRWGAVAISPALIGG